MVVETGQKLCVGIANLTICDYKSNFVGFYDVLNILKQIDLDNEKFSHLAVCDIFVLSWWLIFSTNQEYSF